MSRVLYNQTKILSFEQAAIFSKRAKATGKTIAFTNGCFDILHAGHIHSLQQAATFTDYLIVGLNSDESTKRLKGNERPFNTETDRAIVLAALTCIDAVVIFNEDTPLNLISTIMPQVLVKGGDYNLDNIVGAKEVIENGGKVEIIDLIAGLSTTALSNKIKML